MEATKAAIERLQACHELTNCIIALEADEALAAAKAADAAIAKGTAKGPLAGVPLAHKDMFDRKGKIASWGAKHPRRQAGRRGRHGHRPLQGRPARSRSRPCTWPSSPTARRGTTTCWAMPAIPGTRRASPAAPRPARPTAVAYGAIPAGLGSDTGGSLRLPAACCGVASIKPTWGRVSRAGAMPLAPALDTVGLIARHVEDLALILGFLAGPDPRDPAASSCRCPTTSPGSTTR